jgi:CheY-like chemotaxis protein/phosphoribosyl 1,2-cyclic phosphodiesterase
MNPSSPTAPRILIAEDVNVIALTMTRALEKAGFTVDVARDGAECLRKAIETIPDLVVLDIMMPKMNGIEVLKALRTSPETHEISVLVSSAKDFKTERDVAARLGAVDYLIKSSDPSVLVKKVQSLFGQNQGPAALDEAPAAPKSPVESWQPVLNTSRAHFTLWGTRGSTPTIGGRFQRHGGNTSCMSFRFGDDLFIFDAGSGIRDLGMEIMAGKLRRIHLFVTHTHWDHIQGFPFFVPAYVPGFEITVYGAAGFGKDLESIFSGQLDRDYFPVQMEDMQARIEFRHLPETPIQIGGATITWEFSHHPLPTVGYKITAAGRSIVWMPDNEFLLGYTGSPAALTHDHPQVAPCEKVIRFLHDADVVIHEAQYTPDEYPKKIGWGHSSLGNACLLMKLANVRRWIVTHHDPMHDDAFLEKKLNLTRQILEDLGHKAQVSHGYDGMTEFLEEEEQTRAATGSRRAVVAQPTALAA